MGWDARIPVEGCLKKKKWKLNAGNFLVQYVNGLSTEFIILEILKYLVENEKKRKKCIC